MPLPRFQRLVRKLHGWELDHLREHVAELQAENQRLRDELNWSDDCAAAWRNAAMAHVDEGGRVGLTQAGQILLLPAQEARPC